MKFLLLAACLVLYVASTCGQFCRGVPESRNCEGGKDQGVRRTGCMRGTNLWWYNQTADECFRMIYLGCGGNNNRHCTKGFCKAKCHRRT